MPCMKCNNGKYKYGEHGRCVYDTLEACKRAAAAIHAKPEKAETKDLCAPLTKEVDETNRVFRGN